METEIEGKGFKPTATIGLTLTMVGAFFLHISRGEPIIVNAVLCVLSLTIAFLRRSYFSGKVS
ncbi:MAG: DoxX family protein [Marinoscillum sp.]